MKVLVTGATGYLGSHATAALLTRGHEVTALVRSPAKVDGVLRPLGVVPEQVAVVQGDMTDAAAVRSALAGQDAVVHAAAAVGVAAGDNSALAANEDGAHNVVGQAVRAGCDPVVNLSTTAVFVPPVHPVIALDHPLAEPHTPYGRSKVAVERWVRGLQDAGAPVVTLYPGGVTGPPMPAVDSLAMGIRAGLEQIWPMSSGGQTVVDVRDIAAIIAASMEPGRGPQRHLCGGAFLTWPELADLCDDLTGVRCRRVVVPAPVLRGIGRTLDVVKKLRSFDFPLTADVGVFMTTMVPTDDQPTWEALGIVPHETRDTIEGTIRWMAAEGHLSAKAAGRLASSVVTPGNIRPRTTEGGPR